MNLPKITVSRGPFKVTVHAPKHVKAVASVVPGKLTAKPAKVSPFTYAKGDKAKTPLDATAMKALSMGSKLVRVMGRREVPITVGKRFENSLKDRTARLEDRKKNFAKTEG